MSSSKALERSQALVAVLEQVAMDDARICAAANKAFSATRTELEAMDKMPPFELEIQLTARGWTREEFQVALEARRPRSEASYAVQMAHERTGMRIRQAVERGGTTVNVAVVIPTATSISADEEARAPVIDLGDE